MTGNKRRVEPLDAQLGYWLRFISNRVMQGFSEKLAANGVTVAEWVVLRGLYDHDAVAPSKLADDLKMTRGTISKLVDRLAAKGLVEKSEGIVDRRYQDIALTDLGKGLVPDLATLAEENDLAFFGFLAEGERNKFKAFLKDIARRSGMDSVDGGRSMDF